MVAAAPAVAAELAAKTKGSSSWAPCQAGTAVSESRTAVYVDSTGPSTAAPVSATRRTRGMIPRTSQAAAIPSAAPTPLRIQVPRFIGEVTLTTRSM